MCSSLPFAFLFYILPAFQFNYIYIPHLYFLLYVELNGIIHLNRDTCILCERKIPPDSDKVFFFFFSS